MSLMPCFNNNQALPEGLVLARLLAGYGEIELTMCSCLIATKAGDFDAPIRRVFGQRGAEGRIKNARKDLRGDFANAGLHAALTETLDDMDRCREIRNQYAHCQWYWTAAEGLCFVNFEELAQQADCIDNLMSLRHPIGLARLEEQEAFFNYVKEAFTHLESAYRGWLIQQAMPLRAPYIFPRPSKVARPSLHD